MQIKELFQANNTPAASHLYYFNTGIATPEQSITLKTWRDLFYKQITAAKAISICSFQVTCSWVIYCLWDSLPRTKRKMADLQFPELAICWKKGEQRKALHCPPSSDLKDTMMRNSPIKSCEQIPSFKGIWRHILWAFIQNHVKKCFMCFISSFTKILLNCYS